MNILCFRTRNDGKKHGLITYKEHLTKESKILYITNKEVGKSIIQLALNQYVMMPIRIHAVVPGTIGKLENLTNALQKDNYTHVFVYRATEEAIEEYATIFEENKMKYNTLYEVKKEEDRIQLVEIAN